MKKRGRPIGKIKTRNPSARKFFEQSDALGLGIKDVVEILGAALPDSPAYRTVQEWRRGTHNPRYIPFQKWTEILLMDKKSPTNNDD